MSDDTLLPHIDEINAPFWEGARQGELRVQCCRDTGKLIFPPRTTSPWGDHLPPEWTCVSGTGRIWSFAIPHPPLLPAFADYAPYNVVLVQLEEGPMVYSNLVGVPNDEIRPDIPVEALFDDVTDTVTLIRFRPRAR